MAPTNAEIIGWLVLLAIALAIFIFASLRPSTPEIEITWGQRRDWDNQAKAYERRTR